MERVKGIEPSFRKRVKAEKSHNFGVVAVLWENLIQLPKAQAGHRNAYLWGSLGETQFESQTALPEVLADGFRCSEGLFGLCKSQNGFWRQS